MLETIQIDPLIDEIKAIQDGENEDFWSFKSSRRTGAHALIHYPAMMVPTLQGKLLDAIKSANPGAKNVLDPFVGSGTILVEAMNRGMSFTGIDINPLAILACLAKSGPYFIDAFDEKRAMLVSRVRADTSQRFYKTFEGQIKWFSEPVSVGLSKIARSIELEPSLWARRLFWLALAKIVRSSCNSRMSTYKLHAKSADDRTQVDTLVMLVNTMEKFSRHIRDQHTVWKSADLIHSGHYMQSVDIHLGDSRDLLGNANLKGKFDVVMTSPPYGDNTTTIPYGQYSYLPLKWIATQDICSTVDPRLLSNTQAIDTASLGGSKRHAAARGADLADQYKTARHFSKDMSVKSSEFKRFVVFFADLEDCLNKVCDVTKISGYQTWTIGNRHLGGRRVPMEDILSEMLERRQVSTIGRIRRSIHAKKMAMRNNISATMSTETVLLARKF